MSDNEKRILVLEVSPDCKALKFDVDPFDEEDGMFCDKNGRYLRITEQDCAKCKSPVFAGITRAEAVEKMAKAMCIFVIKDGCHSCSLKKGSGECEAYLDFHKKKAEAALNVLLGKAEEKCQIK